MQTTFPNGSFQNTSRLITTGLGLAALILLGLASAPAVHAQSYTLTTLATFNGTNGADPIAGLTLSANGSTLYGTTLYGTTYQGGTNSDGTVFSVPVTGGTPTTLVSFNSSNSNGTFPVGGLTLSPNGSRLYGTTQLGGANGDGTVFSVPVTGGTPTTLVSFNGTNGESPFGGLTLIGSTLYGTTQAGGAYGDGTVFSVPITGGALTTLISFDGSNGIDPTSGLTLGADGTLYGTTSEGGAYGDGTVFALTPTAAVPEASSVVSFGLLLVGGLGGLVFRARRRSVVG